MPISRAAITNRGDDRQSAQCDGTRCLGGSGFTLLEVSLVLLIMAVVLALTLPRLRDPGKSELAAQAHRLVLTFRLLRSEAALNGNAYRLNYDLDQQRYWVTANEPGTDLEEFAHDIGSLAKGTHFENPIGIADIVLPTLAGKVMQGQVYTVFYPDGSVDSTVIHLGNGRDVVTLYLDPMNGRLQQSQGYQEVNYGG